MRCDNWSAQLLVDHPCFHSKTKHFSIDAHFIHDQVAQGFLKTDFVCFKPQLAECFNKPIAEAQLLDVWSKLGLSKAPPWAFYLFYILHTCQVKWVS